MPKHDTDLIWIEQETSPPQDFKIFQIYQRTSRHPQKPDLHRFVIVDCPPWINVIALTPTHDVVFIRQYRHGTSAVTLEIPGGMVEPDEAPLLAAQRELAEETGFSAPTWIEIGLVQPNPAFQTNSCWTFLALDAAPGPALPQDPGEIIHTSLIPLKDVPSLISSGQIRHALVIAAFFHYLHRFGSWQPPRV